MQRMCRLDTWHCHSSTLLTGGIYKGSKSSKFALEAALNRSGVEEHIPGIYLGYS